MTNSGGAGDYNSYYRRQGTTTSSNSVMSSEGDGRFAVGYVEEFEVTAAEEGGNRDVEEAKDGGDGAGGDVASSARATVSVVSASPGAGAVADREVSSPFAVRQGKSLTFSHICMSLEDKKKSKPATTNADEVDDRAGVASIEKLRGKVILDNVWGEAPAGKITAILGPSGSGKTSLLNVLSGRMADGTTTTSGGGGSDGNGGGGGSRTVRVSSERVCLNGKVVDPTNIAVRQTIAYVAQDDSLPVTATPREALFFSARMRCPRSSTDAELRALTDRMLDELHLTKCADTFIGGDLVKGVSGGERKRTSVGVELVTQPSLVFLDEPTSGLDSFNAMELVHVLKRVAAAGSAVLMTIHQPSSEIFGALDGMIVMKDGRVLFGGMRHDVSTYFAARGFACPPQYNPADYILTVSETNSTELLESLGFFAANPNDKSSSVLSVSDNGIGVRSGKSTKQREQDRERVRKESMSLTHSLIQASAEPKLGFGRQTTMLMWRELKHLKRNKKALAARTGMTLMVSVLGGIIFFQVGKSDFEEFINVQSTFGALVLSLLANVFSTALPSMISFPEERPVFLREFSTNHYTVQSYFCSRLAMEVLVTAGQVMVSSILTYFLMGFSATFGVFWAACYVLAMTSTALGVLIGCSVKDPGVAMEFLPLVFMPQILFSGFFIPPELIPIWLRWLNYVFPLVYAVKIAIVAQFDSGVCDGLKPNFCEQVMQNTNANPDDTWWYWIVLIGQFVFFRSAALLVLRLKANRYY